MQRDLLFGPADLGLSLGALAANRYALAGGNPPSYIESRATSQWRTARHGGTLMGVGVIDLGG